MKNLILFLLCFFPFLSHSQNIKTFYQTFEHSQLKALKSTPSCDVLIDEANQYIHIKNPQMPIDAITFKQLPTQDKRKIFGFQYVGAIVAGTYAVPRYEFYLYQENQWQDITSEIFPKLTFSDFWGNQALPDKMLQEYNLELVLPQSGTTYLANIQPAFDFQFPYGNMPSDYLEVFQKKKYQTIELNWIKERGKFEIGKRY